MLDLLNETCITLADAARVLPPGPGGKPIHRGTLLRWIQRGVKAANGRKVRLRGAKLGDRFVTSREAIAEFTAALSEHLQSEPAAVPRSAGQRRRAAERAGRKLEQIGI